MASLLQLLDAFNRKERFFLFTQAIDKTALQLGESFRESLRHATGISVPPNARAYIDYHMDWLHAAVALGGRTPGNGPWVNKDESGDFIVSTGNQEDVDLLVAFEDGPVTAMILVEAKADSGWSNSQMNSKARRLGKIFGTDEIKAGAPVRPTFCLASPRRPAKLDTGKWPAWMSHRTNGNETEIAWLRLDVPPGRLKVEGCDPVGNPSRHRTHWRVRTVPAYDLETQ